MKVIVMGLAAIVATAAGFAAGLALSDNAPRPTRIGHRLVTISGRQGTVVTPTLSAAPELPPLKVSTEAVSTAASSSTEPFTFTETASEEAKVPIKKEEKSTPVVTTPPAPEDPTVTHAEEEP
jgi:hypothetical protein